MRQTACPNARTVAAWTLLVVALGGGAADPGGPSLDWLWKQGELAARRASLLYARTPPHERMTWGGLGACAALGLVVAAERGWRLRRGRIVPRAFRERFHHRLLQGQLDKGKALDYCELNPSPAARIALAAIRRWGRPSADLDRAVALARQVEIDRLRRHVGTLRRLAVLAPLLGLLGTLVLAGQSLAQLGPGSAWGPALARALAPLTAGVTLAILALVAFDGLVGRVERLANDLDRVGAETIDAIAMATPIEPRPGGPTPNPARTDASAPPIRVPHPIRVEVPRHFGREPRAMSDE